MPLMLSVDLDSGTECLEQRVDGPQTDGLVIQPHQKVAEDVSRTRAHCKLSFLTLL